MYVRTENRATQEQMEKLIQKYNANEKVLDVLYTGKVNTLIMLEHGLQKGIAITRLAGGTNLVTLPECRGDIYLSNDEYSFTMHMTIVKKILTNFVNNNPQYFTLKPNSQRYSITDQFVLDLLLYNKDKGYDYIEFLSLLPFITSPEVFEQITNTFYLPFAKKETFDYVKRMCWHKKKPFTVKNTNISSGKKYILYGSQNIQSVKIGELLETMKLYYDKELKFYHTVAYCTFFPDNLSKLFPLCKTFSYQNIYDLYRDYKPITGSKEKMRNDRDSIIFPRYSIVDCEHMPTLWGYKKIFGKFVSEEANRFIIFVNYHTKAVFHGAGGIGHNIFSSEQK